MKVAFTKKFLKQINALHSKKIKKEILLVISEVETAATLSDIKNLKKLSGYTSHFRIRIGDYRIGLFLNNNTLEFSAFDHRKDIYKYFP